MRRAAEDFLPFYASRQWTPESQKDAGPFLIISVDQKGVVVKPRDLRPAARRIAAAQVRKLRAIHNRDGKKHRSGRKRMATVATVYTIDADPRSADQVIQGLRRLQSVDARPTRNVRPELKRLWASLEIEPKEVMREAFAEAQKRDPHHLKTWIVLLDGDPDLERWARESAGEHKVDVTFVLDFIHALQYLWKAGQDICGSDALAIEAWVLPRLASILAGNVSDVVAGMTRTATNRGFKPYQREQVDLCANYYLRRKSMMGYGKLLALGAPIATGVIEGGCKHLISDRLDLCGARWTVKGADAVLRLRAIVISGDFDDYWDYHEKREHERNHRELYANGLPTPVKRPDVRVTALSPART